MALRRLHVAADLRGAEWTGPEVALRHLEGLRLAKANAYGVIGGSGSAARNPTDKVQRFKLVEAATY
ncbi:hypothetical protein OHB24_21055 [Kribbella sp. NBC_00482]|uniref:hypothetical protein n=1 Tax=Kribbella sp. NBC_00482 TaxID=2975968 RepID=UPI002E17FB04